MLNRPKSYIRKSFRVPLIEESSGKLNELLQKLNGLESLYYEDRASSKRDLDNLRVALGRIEARQVLQLKSKNIQDYEFKVFSQWGEDGIIQFLINSIPSINKTFIEFGVEDYIESNTRFLLINDNWSGLVIDGSEENISKIKSSELYWRYNLTAVQSFVDKDNINSTIKQAGFSGEIGILSIDIDGNDYWVWQAIDVVNPQIVIIEYNSRFGYDKAVTIPYDKEFDRRKAHYSMVYAGASLKAMTDLAKQKGYFFVGTSSGGNNAFFVRSDLKNNKLIALSPKDGFTKGEFREARDEKGNLSYLSYSEEQKILSKLPVVDLEKTTRTRSNK